MLLEGISCYLTLGKTVMSGGNFNCGKSSQGLTSSQ